MLIEKNNKHGELSRHPGTIKISSVEDCLKWADFQGLLVAMSSQILVKVLTRGYWSSIPTFVAFMPIWTSWLWLDRILMFWFVLSLKFRIPPSLRAPYPWLWLPQQRLRNSTTGAQGIALYVREGFRPFPNMVAALMVAEQGGRTGIEGRTFDAH